MIHQITILNPVETFISTQLAELIKPVVSYTSVFYKPGMYRKTRIESKKSTLLKVKNGCILYSGLVDLVINYCKDKNIEVEVIDKSKEDVVMYEPYLPGITFRDDQIKLINSWLDKPRGIIKSPTGSGKTVLGFGCLSSFDEDIRILWLCHTIDLVKQAYDEAIKFGFKSVGRIGGGFSETDKRLTICTRQSFKKIADEMSDLFDVVVVDETHHVADVKGEYWYILSKMLAPFRLGLTASTLKEGLPELAAIGLIGPIVGELSINDAIEEGLLAIPKMKMIKVPISYDVKALRKYHEVYELGVVHRLELNQLIATTAKIHTDKKETVLIMVTQLAHGDNILECLKAIGVDAILVEGLTKAENREKVKNALQNKEIHCVVCSSIWKEGINIPSLSCVINAAGGKDVLQALGRGLRKSPGKEFLYYYDFLDQSHPYLLSHFGERLCFYLDHGWL